MNTAVDTAFEELVAASEEADELHLICAACWPPMNPVGSIALCGSRGDATPRDSEGQHRCARCLALRETNPWPCGH